MIELIDQQLFLDGDNDELIHSIAFNERDPLPIWIGFNPLSMSLSGRYMISIQEEVVVNFTIYAQDKKNSYSSL